MLTILLGFGKSTLAADVHFDLTSRINGQEVLSDGHPFLSVMAEAVYRLLLENDMMSSCAGA